MRVIRSIFAVALLLGVAACTSSDGGKDGPARDGASASAASSTEPSGGAVAGNAALPKKGDCWSLSTEQLDPGMALTATDAEPTTCDNAHNAITIDVIAIPTGRDTAIGALAQSGEALNPQDDELWRTAVVPACASSYAAAFTSAAVEVNSKWAQGAYRSMNLGQRVWLPTADEWAAGARWIRCDLASQTGAPISLTKPTLDIEAVPDELASCLNANAEGFLRLACDDPLVNAQALVTIVLAELNTDNAKSAYEDYASSLAPMICRDAVKAVYPSVTAEVKAALPIKQAFTGSYDCYVDRNPTDPLIK